MTTSPWQRRRRRAAIAPLAAVLMVPVIAMVAFAVDMAWLVQVQAELQDAADAAALAGAGQMMDGYVQYSLPYQSGATKTGAVNAAASQAATKAKLYAGYNAAGGVSSLTLNDSDIEFGTMDSSLNYTTLTAWNSQTPPSFTAYPNTIKVTVRRDATANGSLALFFGPVLGRQTIDLTATASATIYTVQVDSFKNVANLRVPVLSLTYDSGKWSTFIQTGKAPDGQTYVDANGIPELPVYPWVGESGNLGALSLDDNHTDNGTLKGWVKNGLVQANLQGILNGGNGADVALLPFSSHKAGGTIYPSASNDGNGSWNWLGDASFSNDLITTVNQYAVANTGTVPGQAFLMPIFQPLLDFTILGIEFYGAGNNGNNGTMYNVSQVVGVKVISTGNNSSLTLAPAGVVVDINMVVANGSPIPAGSGNSSTLVTTFVSPKLTK